MFAPRGWLKRRVYKKIYQTLSSSAFFDRVWYQANNMGFHEKFTDPVWHYINTGWQRGLNPSDNFDTDFYLSQNNDVSSARVNPLFHFVEYGLAERRAPLPTGNLALFSQLPSIEPLRIFLEKAPRKRITIIVDDNTPAHPIFGDTVLLQNAQEIARSFDAKLRVVNGRAREVSLVPSGNAAEMLRINKHRNYGDIPYQSGELWISTSWSTTLSLENHTGSISLMYLVLGDEISLSKPGFERVMARQILERHESTLFALTAEIRDHLETSYELQIPVSRVVKTFESAKNPVEKNLRSSKVQPAALSGKRTVSVLATPGSPHTLLPLCIQFLERALAQGVLSEAEWHINFFGSPGPEISLLNSIKVDSIPILSEEHYWSLITDSDILIALDEGGLTSPVLLDALSQKTIAVSNLGKPKKTTGGEALIRAGSNKIDDLVTALERAVNFAQNDSGLQRNTLDWTKTGVKLSVLKEIKKVARSE